MRIQTALIMVLLLRSLWYTPVYYCLMCMFLCLSILKNIFKQQIVRGLYIVFECFDWLHTYLQPSIWFVLFLASSLFSRAVIWVLFTSFFKTAIYFLNKIGLWLLFVCVKTFVSISRDKYCQFSRGSCSTNTWIDIKSNGMLGNGYGRRHRQYDRYIHNNTKINLWIKVGNYNHPVL